MAHPQALDKYIRTWIPPTYHTNTGPVPPFRVRLTLIHKNGRSEKFCPWNILASSKPFRLHPNLHSAMDVECI
jgi:hypothetical protein